MRVFDGELVTGPVFARAVVTRFFSVLLLTAGIIVMARACTVHTRQTTQRVHVLALQLIHHLQDRRILYVKA